MVQPENLELNALKTVEIVVDFRKNPAPPSPVILCGSPVDSVESYRFLGTIITQDLKWDLNIRSLIKKAHQRMYFLRQLKKFHLPKTMMVHFYTAIIESILTSSITIWYAAATVKDRSGLLRIISLPRGSSAATSHPSGPVGLQAPEACWDDGGDPSHPPGPGGVLGRWW